MKKPSRSRMTVAEAIRRAERILPGTPVPEGRMDPRWQAIIKIGEFIESDPEPVWEFVARWGKHPSGDLRAAIATCLLEHLLQHHFELVFPRAERLARKSRRFARMMSMCSQFGQAKLPENARRLVKLGKELGMQNVRRTAT